MKHATFPAAVCAVILMLPASDSEAYSDAWVHAHCTTAMKIARDENVKMTDTRMMSWKVEDAWYEEHRDPNESHRDPSGTERRVDEWAQFRCSIVAQCPETPWPNNNLGFWIPADGNPYNAASSNRMYYDDPRRVWLNTAFTGSVTEVQKIRCTEGGYLR